MLQLVPTPPMRMHINHANQPTRTAETQTEMMKLREAKEAPWPICIMCGTKSLPNSERQPVKANLPRSEHYMGLTQTISRSVSNACKSTHGVEWSLTSVPYSCSYGIVVRLCDRVGVECHDLLVEQLLQLFPADVIFMHCTEQKVRF
jgi:hypothetical protein